MPLSGGTSGAHDDSMHQGSAKRDVAEGLAGLDVGGHVLAPGYRFTAARGAAEQITIRERTSDERVFRYIRIGANDYEARVNVGGVEKVVQHAGMKDVASGIAGLDASVEVPLTLLKMDVANGIAGLDAFVEIPVVLLKTDVVNGIAGLDASAEVISRLAYEGAASGVAELDAAGVVPDAQLPGSGSGSIARVALIDFVGDSSVNKAVAHGGIAKPKLVLIVSTGVGAYASILRDGVISYTDASATQMNAVTTMDATNFYVGNAANYTYSCNLTTMTYYCVVIW